MIYTYLVSCLTYKILLTVLITIALVEINFLKLMFLNPYLRSTMSQERLNVFSMILIETSFLKILIMKVWQMNLLLKMLEWRCLENRNALVCCIFFNVFCIIFSLLLMSKDPCIMLMHGIYKMLVINFLFWSGTEFTE